MGARGTSPRSNGDSPVKLIYSGELDDESCSKNTARSPVSPVATEFEPSNNKARTDYKSMLRYSLFRSDEGDESDRTSTCLDACAFARVPWLVPS